MIIVYASKTGNVKRFINKLETNVKAHNVKDIDVVNEPFVLVTYTSGFGKVPKEVVSFLELNHKYLIGVASSGNKNWGLIEMGGTYAKSGDVISEMYSVPLLHKFENSGFPSDMKLFLERMNELDG